MAAMGEAKTDVVVKLKREQRKKDEPLFKIMCHCLHYLVYNPFFFFFFENAKIWVGRTTLNSEKIVPSGYMSLMRHGLLVRLKYSYFEKRCRKKSTKLHKPIPKDSMGRRIELLHVLNTNEI